MEKLEAVRNDKLAQRVIKGLESRNMEGFYTQTKEEALEKALELIEEESSIGWGGSVSVERIGLIKALSDGNYVTVDRSKAKSVEEKEEIQRACFSADYFLTSSNAITEDGILVNIDGNSNRVAAICYGPKKVIMIVGMNKVVKTEADAMARARNVAAPINAQRFPLDTPCKKIGSCMNCMSRDTICCQFLTTRYSRHADRIKVILVNENLGF